MRATEVDLTMRICKAALEAEGIDLREKTAEALKAQDEVGDAISRRAVLNLLYNLPPEETIMKAMLIQSVKQMDAAQPKRKKGKWINDRGLYKCSCCNRLWAECWASAKPIERMRKEMPYCPMCGSYNGEESDNESRMEGSEE